MQKSIIFEGYALGLRGYIGKRIIYNIIVLLSVMSINFAIFVLMPGDPIRTYIRQEEKPATFTPAASKEVVAELKAVFGFDKTLPERYFLYLKNMLTFNFGRTQYTLGYISQEMAGRLGNTMLMISICEVLVTVVGVLMGLLLAARRATKFETGVVTGALTLSSLPSFWIGLLVMFFFAFYLRWFPSGREYPVEWLTNPPKDILTIIVGRLYHLVLPVLTLFIYIIGSRMLFVRACALESITEDFVVTARAKGLKERTVLMKHVFKPASLPIITSLTVTFALSWTGAMITETVFNYQGMGRWILTSINRVDMPVLFAWFYMIALSIIIANFVADILYGLVDPRVKVG